MQSERVRYPQPHRASVCPLPATPPCKCMSATSHTAVQVYVRYQPPRRASICPLSATPPCKCVSATSRGSLCPLPATPPCKCMSVTSHHAVQSVCPLPATSPCKCMSATCHLGVPIHVRYPPPRHARTCPWYKPLLARTSLRTARKSCSTPCVVGQYSRLSEQPGRCTNNNYFLLRLQSQLVILLYHSRC